MSRDMHCRALTADRKYLKMLSSLASLPSSNSLNKAKPAGVSNKTNMVADV